MSLLGFVEIVRDNTIPLYQRPFKALGLSILGIVLFYVIIIMGFVFGILYILIVVAILMVVGLFVEGTAALLIFVPVFMPLVQLYGLDQLQFALIVIVTILIGTVTPPIGVAYFTSSSIAKASLEIVAVEMMPFIIAEFGVLFLMMVFAPLPMYLPTLWGFVG